MISIREQIGSDLSVDVKLQSETSGELTFEMPEQTMTVSFGMTDNSPVRINRISVRSEQHPQAEAPISWDNLEASLDQAAEQGFEGVVLVTRDGEIVFQKGYGFANREKKITNTVETVFGIGSQPIDFTHVAILLLLDRGKLDLDDPITKFFADVPDDKQSITIRQLMTGQSGFPDFHDRPSDENKDHSWIDRDEAVKRMLAHELLFEPGEGEQHSHSAWGMLAAIVELVSGQTYQEFTTQHLFEPAGMKDTGFYGDEVPAERIAVGYGELKSSQPNSPPHWGKTSWLVMGSGGQVSTLPDMLRWESAVKAGKLLSPESTRLFLDHHNGLATDGSMYGFEFMHSYDPDSLFLLLSNSVETREKRRSFMALGRRLHQLISGAAPQIVNSKYSLGVAMKSAGDGQLVIAQVVPDSAAQRDGLRVDDRMISANGKPFDENTHALLQSILQDGRPIEFVIERDGNEMKVKVTPKRK